MDQSRLLINTAFRKSEFVWTIPVWVLLMYKEEMSATV